MGVRDWSTTADDNGNSDPTINWAEGQMPSTVNNSARSMMAALAAYFADSGGKLISGGTSNAYTLSTNMVVTALGAPLTLMFEADRDNTGAATLAVDGLTAKPIVNQAGSALSAGDIVDGGVYFAIYNPTADKFVLMNVAVIRDAAVTEAKLATNAVVTAKIADGAVTLAKLATAVAVRPTSSSYPVGAVIPLIKTNAGTLADGATIAGANLAACRWFDTGATDDGVSQLGTWRNISGGSIVQWAAGTYEREA
ncbi:hypothetical protein [Kaistia terrae]|uniref:Phage tail protein n=1 Tax=Kaistia terrae TaxID=537017 RepID=A0ABW0Q352_9HYPH|nr:hypothetical protein [Kaistia terrae]MCX5581497.1 hypothetical protein [Kaistia terrae]